MMNLISQNLDSENLFDISDPSRLVEIKLSPNEKLEIHINYLERLEVC